MRVSLEIFLQEEQINSKNISIKFYSIKEGSILLFSVFCIFKFLIKFFYDIYFILIIKILQLNSYNLQSIHKKSIYSIPFMLSVQALLMNFLLKFWVNWNLSRYFSFMIRINFQIIYSIIQFNLDHFFIKYCNIVSISINILRTVVNYFILSISNLNYQIGMQIHLLWIF